MIESCFGNHLNVQHATDHMGTYLMYLWAINVIVIIDLKGSQFVGLSVGLAKQRNATQILRDPSILTHTLKLLEQC